MKKITHSILVLFLSAGMFSCTEFLDREPTNYSSEGFYKSEAAVEDGVSGVYSALYIDLSYNLPFNILLDHWTPLALERAENTTIGAGGTLNPDNASVQTWWNALYKVVSRANSVLNGAEPFLEDLSREGKSVQFLAEAKTLRAFAYYNLIATYGAVPFYTKALSVDEYNSPRTEPAEVADFLITDLLAAADNLPWMADERGRVDKAVALGLVSRIGLLAGSLDYNGDAARYFKIAADAAGQVIGQRELAANFDDLFNITGQAKEDVRNEALFELMYSNHGVQKIHMIGFGQVSRNYGQTGRHPSQLLVDTYECIDGKRIDESPLYNPKAPWENRDPRLGSTIWMHGDTAEANTNGTDAGRVKLILELFRPTTKFYDFATDTWKEQTNADINSGAAWTSFANAGVGYIWKKYSWETAEAIGAQTSNPIILRYAEVLLNYAEAKIELGELDNSVYDAINEVRNRVGMPSVSSDRMGDVDKMRQLVRRERKVELALEGIHFVDMRRWKTGDIENDSPSYGYPLAQTDGDGNVLKDGYELATPDMVPNFKKSPRHDLNDIANYDLYKSKLKVRDVNRLWSDRFYLFPVPQIERDRAPNLGQNTGY